MMDPAHPEMTLEHDDMKFIGATGADRHRFGDDMKMSAEETSGMQYHNPSTPPQPKTMRYLGTK